jgi:hypothetical protein
MSGLACSKCGAAVLPTGLCSGCGHNVHVDLEIAAFMAPHINRARIMLVVIGVLYLVVGYFSYGDVAQIDAMVGQSTGPEAEELRSIITLAYVIVGYLLVSGAANVILAMIAGTHTMLAFNIAGAIFLVHTALQIYASGATVLTSWLFWLTAIVFGLGYTAARKAHALRAGA